MHTFIDYLNFREGKENFEQPHVISADPPIKIPSTLERLVEAFKKSKEVPIGKEVDSKGSGEKDITLKTKKLYLVGGAVRDYLLGHTPRNYNLATDAHPDEVEKICLHAKPPIQVLKKGKDSTKVSVNGETYEIETMKTSKGELTINPHEDVERRDVTANSLYYDIAAKKIYDYTGGIRHIKDGHVKFIGDPKEKVKENGAKHRYARMLGKIPNSKIDDDAKEAITGHMNAEDSPEKIKDEFWKGLEDLHANSNKYIKNYKDLNLLKTVFPNLNLSDDLPNSKSRPIVIASLLKNNSPKELTEKLKDLKYTDREVKDAVFLINLLLYKPEFSSTFREQLVKTSLTKRQVQEWIALNNLQVPIEKIFNY